MYRVPGSRLWDDKIKMAEPPPPKYALRAHTTDVTALCICVVRAKRRSGGAHSSSSSRDRACGRGGNGDRSAGSVNIADASPSHNYTILASGSTDGLLKLWDLASRRVCLEIDDHGGRGIIGLIWVAKDSRLVSQGRDGCMRVWSVRASLGSQDNLLLELDVAFVMEHGSYTFTRSSYSAAEGGLFAAPASNDAFFEVWNARTGMPLIAHCVTRKQGGKTGMVMSLKLIRIEESCSGNGEEKAICGDDVGGDQDFNHERDDSATADEKKIGSESNCGVDTRVSAGGARNERAPGKVAVIVGVESGEIGFFTDAASTANLISIENSSCVRKDVESPVASQALGFTGDDAFWISAHDEPVLCLDVAVCRLDTASLVCVSGSADTSICVFTARSIDDRWSFGEINKITLKSRGVADVRLRPDGRIFAAACWDGHVRVYGMKRRRQLAVLRFHNAGVHAVAFPALGTQAEEAGILVSASKDARIAVWSIYPPAN